MHYGIWEPPMTRSILNWSEVLEQYRGKSIEKKTRLKKWSEMGNTNTAKSRYISRNLFKIYKKIRKNTNGIPSKR